MKLSEIFIVKNGLASSHVDISDIQTESSSLRYIRPSSKWSNLVAGYLNPNLIPEKYIFPKNTLFVSTDGEGSHTYSYVSPFEFVPNSNVAVLIPKKKLSLKEKIYYATCITKNRYKFSYGRKPKGIKLKKIELPDIIPEWVEEIKIPEYNFSFIGNKTKKVYSSSLKRVDEIFDVSYGTKLDYNKMTIVDENTLDKIAFISRKSKDLGFVSYVKKYKSIQPLEAGLITVTLGGTYLLSSFVQLKPFYTAQNIAVLKPKENMTNNEKIFYCMCIERNRFRYGAFGREANRTLKEILIPSDVPSWVYEKKLDKYLDNV